MLKTHWTCNSTVKILKYEINNKLLDGVTLLWVTSSITWIKLIYNRMSLSYTWYNFIKYYAT